MQRQTETVQFKVAVMPVDILRAIQEGQTLAEAAEALCREVEEALPGAACSLMSVDDHGRAHPVAGPSLPQALRSAFGGLSIGPMVGSCGSAIATRKPVEAAEIATDPRWTHYAALPLSFGLQACWSTPILAKDGRALGAFALYFKEVRSHTEHEAEIVQATVAQLAPAMERDRILAAA